MAYFVARAIIHVPHWIMDVLHVLILLTIGPHLLVLAMIGFYQWLRPPLQVTSTSMYDLAAPPLNHRFRPAASQDLEPLARIGQEIFAAVTPMEFDQRLSLYRRVMELDPDSFRVIETLDGKEVVGFTIATTFKRSTWRNYYAGKWDYRSLEPAHLVVRPKRSRYVYLGTALSVRTVRHNPDLVGMRCAVHHVAELTKDHAEDAIIFTSLSNRKLRRVMEAFGFTCVASNFVGWPIWELQLTKKRGQIGRRALDLKTVLNAVRLKP